MKYHTKNQKQILSILIDNCDKHLCIEEIDALLNHQVPLASLYRVIDSLVEEGVVRKFSVDNNLPCCFQYCSMSGHPSHFHMLCTKCGKLYHLDCDEVNALVEHVYKEHNFQIDINKVNLYGVCESCLKLENRS